MGCFLCKFFRLLLYFIIFIIYNDQKRDDLCLNLYESGKYKIKMIVYNAIACRECRKKRRKKGKNIRNVWFVSMDCYILEMSTMRASSRSYHPIGDKYGIFQMMRFINTDPDPFVPAREVHLE